MPHPGLYLVATLYFRPYAKRKAWKLPVKVASLVALIVLSVCAHLIRQCEFEVDRSYSVEQRSKWASIVSIVVCGTLVVIFFIAFIYTLLRGAQKEHFKRLSFRKSLKCAETGSAIYFDKSSSGGRSTSLGELNLSTDSQSQLWAKVRAPLAVPANQLAKKSSSSSASSGQTATV